MKLGLEPPVFFKKNFNCSYPVGCMIIITLVALFSIYAGNEVRANTRYTQEDAGLNPVQASTHPETVLDVSRLFPAPEKNCLACHKGLVSPRPPSSEMMQKIYDQGRKLGDPNGCVVCHGGDPLETKDKKKAHTGAPQGSLIGFFTPVPGALQVNSRTCAQCHTDHTYNVHRSIMNTDAGKMKAITWSWGIDAGEYQHIYGNHAIDDPDGDLPRFGTNVYKSYMQELAEKFPGQFPKALKQIPEADLALLGQMPEQAAFTYLRNCNACHLSNKGHQDRGHFRGMGCAACHTLYNNEGLYEGNDKSIKPDEPGHLMVHAMMGTRKSGAKINNERISGIQVSTCAACHSAGRRIGHAYQGFMALGRSYNKGPFDEKGNPQPTNAGYVFKQIREDVHHRIDKDKKSVKGLVCQDCHTTNAMHGNGNIGATTLAGVEVECADCHGTPAAFPWELPLGFGDEFGRTLDQKERGVSQKPLPVTDKFATEYNANEGYLLTARGNPFGNVVKKGQKVMVFSASGNDFEVPLLKEINLENGWQNPLKATTSMVTVDRHMESLECYACHSTWVPQYYGYKYIVDYSKESVDWLASAEVVMPNGTTADYNKNFVVQPGASTLGDYSHLRWENPPLGINGEGRVSTLTGVIQTVGTVIGPTGEVIVHNHVGKRPNGINAMELAPVNAHTTSLEARDCRDCHGSQTAMGYGIQGGAYDSRPDMVKFADVVDANGQNISRNTRPQIAAIAQLHGDFMQLLTPEGEQLMTIDSHWGTSMPLTLDQRQKLTRQGTCIACHRDILDGSIPIKMLGQIAKIVNLSFASPDAHETLLRENNILIAWVKVLGIFVLMIMVVIAPIIWIKRKKIRVFLLAKRCMGLMIIAILMGKSPLRRTR